jgi:hypothetical protein
VASAAEGAVTEQDWLTGTDPSPMLASLRGRASGRKLRLFACACCRHIWHLLPDEQVRGAVEAAERFADGLADAGELKAACLAARSRCRWGGGAPYAAAACAETGDELWEAGAAAAYAAKAAAKRRQRGPPPGWLAAAGLPEDLYSRSAGSARKAVEAAQAAFLRCLFGNPFRAAPVDPVRVRGTVAALARGIYEERGFDRLPVLADALQDAGCEDEDLLAHCRGPGPHFRGCWVIDRLLGKR